MDIMLLYQYACACGQPVISGLPLQQPQPVPPLVVPPPVVVAPRGPAPPFRFRCRRSVRLLRLRLLRRRLLFGRLHLIYVVKI